jgi:hypothetical protein
MIETPLMLYLESISLKVMVRPSSDEDDQNFGQWSRFRSDVIPINSKERAKCKIVRKRDIHRKPQVIPPWRQQ